jgi:DNA end-binding protein Ku
MSTAICERPEPSTETAASPATPTGAASPRGRSSWSGLLRLSLVAVPVKAYPACSTSAAIHFNQLHANCGQRVQYQKRCPVHGSVEAAEIVRGYQCAPDQYVVVEPDELEKVRPAKDKALVLEQFLAVHDVDPVLFAGRSLYLLPDGVAARHPYGVVAEALQQGGKWALGRVVLSANRQLVLVRPWGRLLVMDVLHYPAQVRAAATWEAELRGNAASAEEMRLASTLIDAASRPVDWSGFRDVTAEELTTLIEAKVAGRPLAASTEEPVAVLHLLDALKQSVAAVQDTKTAKAKPQKSRSQRRAAG